MNLTRKTIVADPDPHWEYGSESRRAKITHKSEENSSFEVPDVLFLRDEDFCCSLDVPYGGLGISKLQFFKKFFFFRL